MAGQAVIMEIINCLFSFFFGQSRREEGKKEGGRAIAGEEGAKDKVHN